MTPTPPRLALLFVARLLRGPIRAHVLGDLDALFHEQVRRRGIAAARAWYWKQVWRSVRYGFGSRRLPSIPAPGHNAMSLPFDVRLALRSLIRDPKFTIAVVTVLALGVGASSATYSIVRAVLLAPLPYDDPDRLVILWHDIPARDRSNWPLGTHDIADYRAAASLKGVAGVTPANAATILVDGNPTEVQTAAATVNLLDVLGVAPLLGGTFAAIDEAPVAQGSTPPPTRVMISHSLWRSAFGADSDVIGQLVQYPTFGVEVIGVLPPDFRLHLNPATSVVDDIDIWFPWQFDPTFRNTYILSTVARLAPGAGIEQAQAEVDGIVASQFDKYPVYGSAGVETRLEPMLVDLTRGVSSLVWTLFATAAALLAVACTNVAALVLLRISGRRAQLAVQMALGASRSALLRQLAAEAVLLATLGSVAGLGLATFAMRTFIALVPTDVPRLQSATVAGPVVAYGISIAFAITLLASIWATWRGTSARPLESLRQSASSDGHRHRRTQGSLVGAGVALSFTLLIGSAHMVETFVRVQSGDLGFLSEGVVTFKASPANLRSSTAEEHSEYLREFDEWLSTVPGAEVVGAISVLPLSGQPSASAYGTQEAVASGDESAFRVAEGRWVRPGYFEAVRSVLVEGRFINAEDQRSGAPVIVVDDLLAERHWPGQSALGRRIAHRFTSTTGELATAEIVGVVRHQHHYGVVAEDTETIYAASSHLGGNQARTWVVRTADPDSLLASIRNELASIEPETTLAEVQLLDELVKTARAPTRFATTLVAVFGAVGLVLAMAGLQSMLARVVGDRRREIGIRMALGSRPSRVVQLVAAESMLSVAFGLVGGALGGYLLTRYLASTLPEIQATSPAVYVAAAAAFLITASLASTTPLRAVLRVNPLEVTRAE